uniref:Uncharacterized protein n=1 Tax=Anguilla anguilla TaxID=7936 RepID=A0A0E9R9L5_ANGAN
MKGQLSEFLESFDMSLKEMTAELQRP